MGAIWTRIWGKPSTKALLEKISDQLASIEEFKRDTQAWHKKVIGYLLLYFSSLYFLAAAVVYFKYYHDPRWQDVKSQLKLFLPFLIAPFIFWVVKRGLTWWYHRKLRRNEEKLQKLRQEKTKILEEVMETETYKVAKEILDKYGGAAEHLLNAAGSHSKNASPLGTPTKSSAAASANTSELRRRHSAAGPAAGAQPMAIKGPDGGARQNTGAAAASNGNTASGGGGPPVLRQTQSFRATPLGSQQQQQAQALQGFSRSLDRGDGGGVGGNGSPLLTRNPPHRVGGQQRPPGPPMPRPILPRERGYMDKMVEYLVGDGPSNRYALICKQCQSHNGMALREEFEFISYRCCYCFCWNPARKQRPTAPKLPASMAGGGSAPLSASAVMRRSATANTTIRESSGTETTDDESENPPAASVRTTAAAAAKPAPPTTTAAAATAAADSQVQPKTLPSAAAVTSDSSSSSCDADGASDLIDRAGLADTAAPASTAEKPDIITASSSDIPDPENNDKGDKEANNSVEVQPPTTAGVEEEEVRAVEEDSKEDE